ncbi:hypothetical protein JQ588_36105 [Bradyrhizobium liaoningense]|nr:hypothetical protein [Bradyrhizobium liaoningense]
MTAPDKLTDGKEAQPSRLDEARRIIEESIAFARSSGSFVRGCTKAASLGELLRYAYVNGLFPYFGQNQKSPSSGGHQGEAGGAKRSSGWSRLPGLCLGAAVADPIAFAAIPVNQPARLLAE